VTLVLRECRLEWWSEAALGVGLLTAARSKDAMSAPVALRRALGGRRPCDKCRATVGPLIWVGRGALRP
jgi:hypothetical protein